MPVYKILEQLVVDFLHFLKDKSGTIWFITKHLFIFILLVALFLILNSMLCGYPPISDIAWWEPFANGYGNFLAIMRGIWGPILLSPGSFWYHLYVFTHYLLTIAPAMAILLLIFVFLGVVQMAYFLTGLISLDTADRQFKTFLQKYKFWLLPLLILLVALIIKAALFDPRESLALNPSCGGPHLNIDGLKSISENTLICYWGLDLAIVLFVVGISSFVLTPLVFSKKDQGDGSNTSSRYTSLGYWSLQLQLSIWRSLPIIMICIGCLPFFCNLVAHAIIFTPIMPMDTFSYLMVTEVHWFSHQYSSDSDNFSIGMASPSESSNKGWFSGFKDWWSGESKSKLLTPVESTQKNIELLNQHVEGEMQHCRKYDAKIESSSPRSAAAARVMQNQCWDSVIRLQRCAHKVSLNAARTNYSEGPDTFISAAGKEFGEKISGVAAPLMQELAEKGIRATADSLNAK